MFVSAPITAPLPQMRPTHWVLLTHGREAILRSWCIRSFSSSTDRLRAAVQGLSAKMIDSIGPYQIVALLGEGGMGIVYQAVHQETGAQDSLSAMGQQDPRGRSHLGQRGGDRCRNKHLTKVPNWRSCARSERASRGASGAAQGHPTHSERAPH